MLPMRHGSQVATRDDAKEARGAAHVGIDPGASGGIAIIHEDGSVIEALKIPTTEKDVLNVLIGWGRAFAMLERVRSMPGNGVASTFKFGQHYGMLRMALVAGGVPFDEVTPQRWQKAMGCLSGGDKNVTKRRAQELFPQQRVTHAVADALLIAEYCRRSRLGIL